MKPRRPIQSTILSLPISSIIALLSSCADEDMALVGALATGAASGYAQSLGDSDTAASLLATQKDILNEASNTAAANEQSSGPSREYTIASPVPGKEGFVYSPYTNKIVNVQEISPGTLVQDPTYSGDGNGYFRVPSTAGQTTVAANPGNPAASGITGTWSNAKLTWTLGADGSATLVVPSTNGNGVATTYMTYTAESGIFAYHITRATLTGTLNCNGLSDYDMTVDKSYTEKYTLNGNTLTIGTEVMQRN